MNGQTEVISGEMSKQVKNWVYFVITVSCLLIVQVIGFLAEQHVEERKYVLNVLALYATAVQWIAFLHAGGFFGNVRTEKYYDLTGSLTFLTTTALSLYFVDGKVTARQTVLASFVVIWSIRLGWFLFSRIHSNNGIDSRFTVIKQSRPRFLLAWTLQGVWVWITLLPVVILNQSKETIGLDVMDYIGAALWIVGFSIEVVADAQKNAFRKKAANKDKWISSGLWSISRHPNYFGEILLWIGIALSAFSGLGCRPNTAFVFLSPTFVTLLLIFISGIPLLEERSNRKFVGNDEFLSYKMKTPVLVPFLGRKGDAKF